MSFNLLCGNWTAGEHSQMSGKRLERFPRGLAKQREQWKEEWGDWKAIWGGLIVLHAEVRQEKV